MNKNKNKQHAAEINSIPKIIFTPFKKNRNLSVFFTLLSMISSLIIIYSVLTNKISFTEIDLRELVDFVVTFIFSVSALGFTIFSISLKEEHPKKNEIVFSYIGQIIFLTAVSIFAYIISFLNFVIPSSTISIAFCLLLILLCRCITGLLSTIVAYFNIRD